MKTKVTLLITCVGGAMSPNAIAELRRSALFDFRIVGVNASSSVPARRMADAFYQVPVGDSPDYIPALMDVVQKEGVDVVLPWSDEEAFAVSGALGELERAGCKALVSSPGCLDLIADKHQTYRNLEDAGIRVPEFTPVADLEGLVAALKKYGHPERTVVVKPSRGRGGRGLYVLCGGDDPPAWLGTGKREGRKHGRELGRDDLAGLISGETLVMPCLGVPAYDADVLGLDRGEYFVVVRRRANPTGIPFMGNTIVADPAVVEYCRDVAKTLGLEALHDIDLMTGPDGKPVVLEVNPRPSGSLPASMAAGFPLIEWAVARALSMPLEPIAPDRLIEIGVVSCPFALVNG